MNYKLYGLFSGDELVYVGKVEDAAQAVYALRPIGNWYEWHWTEEEEGERSII